MAIRVRKLAKRLGKHPTELLGVLHALGIERYKSPEDMLSKSIEDKLVGAIRDGLKPLVVTPERVRREKVAVETVSSGGLIPGVKRSIDDRFVKDMTPKSSPKATSKLAPPPVLAERAPSPSAPVPVVDDGLMEDLRAAREALRTERLALTAEREALEALRATEPAVIPLVEAPSLTDILTRRGLRGMDEFERALRILAENRRLAELLPMLSVSDPDGLETRLRDMLVLVDGPAPPGLANQPLLTVSKDRAEIPGAAEWRRLTSKLSEALLLQGARRVVFVGGSTRMHRLLAGALDPRIEIRFRPEQRVGIADAEQDVARTDALVLWNVELQEGCESVYGSGRAIVSRVEGDSIRGLLEGWTKDLSGQ